MILVMTPDKTVTAMICSDRNRADYGNKCEKNKSKIYRARERREFARDTARYLSRRR
ncbi:hypothetical protein SEA_JUMBO_88 [Gordonia phage Jumbo]|uniref:Uncharacterized protein n=1 Tax=Gordonia phage Jumbo TaxID=1887650 RepID=A0A1B3B0V2_9CAUD|nr:hypothetical protein BIZ69_gp088 [Gordonia phage Jumbo]AOE44596.1 hypothetical protein SEA_JUMBO_88 [Gordonia phage Jumbo]